MALEGDSDDIQIDECFLISGGVLKKCYAQHVIPRRDCIVDEGRTYFHCSTVPPWASKLFTGLSRKQVRVLSRTDIMQQLLNARTDKLKDVVAKSVMAHQELMSVCQSKFTPMGVSRKAALPDLPSTVLIDAPSINNVEGVTMRVLVRAKYHTTAPLYVELTPKNISYIRAACLEQINSCDIKRSRKASVVGEGECDVEGGDDVACTAEVSSDEEASETGGAHERHPYIESERETEREPLAKRLKFSSSDTTKRVQSSLNAFFQPCRS